MIFRTLQSVLQIRLSQKLYRQGQNKTTNRGKSYHQTLGEFLIPNSNPLSLTGCQHRCRGYQDRQRRAFALAAIDNQFPAEGIDAFFNPLQSE